MQRSLAKHIVIVAYDDDVCVFIALCNSFELKSVCWTSLWDFQIVNRAMKGGFGLVRSLVA